MKLILVSALAIAAIAGAASAQGSRIAYGDLNLDSAAGAAAFDARVEAAARTMCKNATRPSSHLNDSARCAAAIRAEAVAQLPAEARAQYAANRQPITL